MSWKSGGALPVSPYRCQSTGLWTQHDPASSRSHIRCRDTRARRNSDVSPTIWPGILKVSIDGSFCFMYFLGGFPMVFHMIPYSPTPNKINKGISYTKRQAIGLSKHSLRTWHEDSLPGWKPSNWERGSSFSCLDNVGYLGHVRSHIKVIIENYWISLQKSSYLMLWNMFHPVLRRLRTSQVVFCHFDLSSGPCKGCLGLFRCLEVNDEDCWMMLSETTNWPVYVGMSFWRGLPLLQLVTDTTGCSHSACTRFSEVQNHQASGHISTLRACAEVFCRNMPFHLLHLTWVNLGPLGSNLGPSCKEVER